MKGSIRIRNNKYSYYFKYKDEYGKWKSKEKSGFATKKEAESALRKAITAWEEMWIIEKSSKYTLGEYTEYWFENVAELKMRHKTLTLYRSVNKNHIAPHLSSVKLSDIKPDTLQRFFTDKQKTVGTSTVGAIRNVLNNVLVLAVKQKILNYNPMKSIELISTKQIIECRALNKEALELILKELEGTHWHVPFMIAIHTGVRRGEALGLVWEDIDFAKNTISINKQLQSVNTDLTLTHPKTEKSVREFQMTKILSDYLYALRLEQINTKIFYDKFYYKGEDFVCCHKDGYPIRPSILTCKARNLSKKINVNFCFHDLRHSHATMMLEADVNIKVLQERLGHSDIETTLNVYSHVTKRLEDQSLERFNAFF